MARRKTAPKPPVDQETIEACLANVIAQGDIVNFRFLFLPYSPLRNDSTEDISTDKYAYLLPEDEDEPHYKEALGHVRQPQVRMHVNAQLEKKGPAQLPAELVLPLADNAARLGKYTSAAQAYELLRIRRHMQEEFLRQADQALDANDVPRAVRGYIIATGLEYDYAAFPEPLPAVPNFQARALLLHAEYPARPEDSLGLQPLESHVKIALGYLLIDPQAAARLDVRSLEQRLDFLVELVHRRDPEWAVFAARFRDTCETLERLEERFRLDIQARAIAGDDLAKEIEQQRDDEEFRRVPAQLLGREIEDAEWWQYLKELAYRHPAAALFVARQAVSKDLEIILPRYAKNSPLAQRLGLSGMP